MQIFSYQSEIDGIRVLPVISMIIIHVLASSIDRDFQISLGCNHEETSSPASFNKLTGLK